MYLVTYRLDGKIRYEEFISLGDTLLDKRAAWENASNYAEALKSMDNKYGKISDIKVDWEYER